MKRNNQYQYPDKLLQRLKTKQGMKRGKEFERTVAKLLHSCNLYFLHIDNYRCFKCGQVQNSKAEGFPDFHVPELNLYIECKTGKGTLSKSQQRVKKIILKNSNNKYMKLKDNVDHLLHYLNFKGYIKL